MFRLQYANWSGAEYLAALACLVRGRVSRGDAIARLERAFADLYGCGAVHAVNSGRTAIALALESFRRRSPGRSEVLLPSYICPSVVEQVQACGLTPVALAVGDDLNLLPSAVAAALSHQTLAVIAPHMYGCPCAIDAIEALCRAAGVWLIDDAAQVVAIRQEGRLLGSYGDVGIVSFAQSKAIVTGVGGSGGLLLVNRPELQSDLAAAVGALPAASGRLAYLGHFLWDYLWHGKTGSSGYHLARVGRRLGWRLAAHGASRIGNLDAAVALVQLQRIAQINAERVRLVELYRQQIQALPELALPQYGAGRFLSRIMLALPPGVAPKAVAAVLKAQGVATRQAYPPLVQAPERGAFGARLLEVPSFRGMTEQDVAAICRQLDAAVKQCRPAGA